VIHATELLHGKFACLAGAPLQTPIESRLAPITVARAKSPGSQRSGGLSPVWLLAAAAYRLRNNWAMRLPHSIVALIRYLRIMN
jgi:hypothetical protein